MTDGRDASDGRYANDARDARPRLAGRAVVFVSNFGERRLGGGEIRTMHLVRGALASGMKVSVVAMPGSGIAEAAADAGAAAVEDDIMAGGPLAGARRLEACLRAAGADIVYGTGYYTNLVARLAGHGTGCCVVNSVLCEPAATVAISAGLRSRLVQWMREAADNATAGRMDVLIVNSFAVRRDLVAQGLPASRIEVVHDGIDIDATRRQADLGHVRVPGLIEDGALQAGARTGSAGSRSFALVGTVGRLEAVKGLDVFLDAVRVLAGQRADVRAVIAGEGRQAEHLRARIEADPALARTVSLAGFVPGPALMAQLDVYCLPSLSEGMNTSILEALALGVPVVATAVGGTVEVVEDGVTGRVVPPGDAAALAQALASTLDDLDAARRLATAGRARVERDFSASTMVARTLDIYERVLG